MRLKMVGPPRIELGTSCTPCKRAPRLRYGPKIKYYRLPKCYILASFFFIFFGGLVRFLYL